MFHDKKEFIKQFIPPVLLKIKSQSNSAGYKTYEEALAVCSKGGYEAQDLVKVVVEKNILFQKTIKTNPCFDLGSLRTLIGIGLAKNKNSLAVLDFGGGGGYHYTIASTALGEHFDLRWNVVETTAMSNEAQKISNKQLKFFDSIEKASADLEEIDLVFTSGTLHYCPKPLYFLEKLLSIKAKNLFITRTAFNDTENILVNVQKSFLSSNGPGPLPDGFKDKAIFYPNVFVSKMHAEKMISEQYDIRFGIIEDKAVYRVGNKNINMYGYFCSLKATPN